MLSISPSLAFFHHQVLAWDLGGLGWVAVDWLIVLCLSLAGAGMTISGLLSLTCSSGYGLSSTRTISTPLQRDGEIEYHSSQNPESSSRLSRLIRNR